MTVVDLKRAYSRGEIAADAAVHALGVGFALIGGPILIGLVAARGDAWPIVAMSIYVATLIAMLSFSATYNLITFPAAKEWLRRLDHSTIYLKIAGAYTPFAMISIGGFVGNMLLGVVWGAAALGVVLKLLFPRRFELFGLLLYLAMGWVAVIVYGDVADSLKGPTLQLVTVAGGLYTLGVVFFMWERLPFQNAIWHVFVLAATVTLYSAMAVEFV
ncbi:MAG: hemolysin III family protein [Pseudomonadota bacterium]